MEIDDKISLSKIRIELAEECLRDAKILIDNDSYKASANRSYYAVFHSMRSVLALDGIDSKKHSGIIAEFRFRYIKSGIFEKEISKIINGLFSVRTDSDYNDFYVLSKDDTENQYKQAEIFVRIIKEYLQNNVY